MAAPTTSQAQACGYCKFEFPLDKEHCPHCALPSLFPNVTLAKQPQEFQKLDRRYREALGAADTRGCRAVVDQFTNECRNTTAVMRCELMRLHLQIASGSEIFAPYYDLERLRLRSSVSNGFNYEKLRPQAEIELLGNEKHVGLIHYACLSLDGQGLSSYGNCIITLAEPMVGHRATCFEGNTAVIYAIESNFDDFIRSDWANRHLICTAVMAGQLNSTKHTTDFPGILARPDPNNQSENDVFIEVHIFGSLTAHSFESVVLVTASPRKGDRVYRTAVIEKLRSCGVTVSVV